MNIKILNPLIKPEDLKPSTKQSAGLDLRSMHSEEIHNGDVRMIYTGIALEIPEGCFGLIAPRSGLGTKGLVMANGLGIADSDYRGEIKVPLWNRNEYGKPFSIKKLDRVAQIVILTHMDWSKVKITDDLSITERGDNGFNSTGSK